MNSLLPKDVFPMLPPELLFLLGELLDFLEPEPFRMALPPRPAHSCFPNVSDDIDGDADHQEWPECIQEWNNEVGVCKNEGDAHFPSLTHPGGRLGLPAHSGTALVGDGGRGEPNRGAI